MIPIIIQQQQKIKYLRINNQRGERCTVENYKTLLKEILKDTHKWKAIPCSGAVILNGVKMSCPQSKSPHTPCRNPSLSSAPTFCSVPFRKIRPKVSMDSQNSQITKLTWKE